MEGTKKLFIEITPLLIVLRRVKSDFGVPFIILFTYKYLFEKNGNYCYFSFYLKGRKKAFCKSTLILSKLQRKYGAGGYRQPYFSCPILKTLQPKKEK